MRKRSDESDKAVFSPDNLISAELFGEKLGYTTSHLVPLGKEMIQRYGLSMGVYDVYVNPISQQEYVCEVDGCNQQLLEIRCAIKAVMEPDGTWYTIDSLKKDPELFGALLETNRKAVMCLKHRTAGVFLLSEQPLKEESIVIPITKDLRIRADKVRKKKKKPNK